MKKVMMLSFVATSLMAASAAHAVDADALRDAAQAADKAAAAKSAELNASAKANNEQAKADMEAKAAVSDTTVTGTIKHRAKQASHKIKAVGDKASAKVHGATAEHYENKAAADVSASVNAQ